MKKAYALGLDIGTTSISAVVLDPENGDVLASRTEKSCGDIPCDNALEKIQDPEKIRGHVLRILEGLLGEYPQVKSIGITGQMHGILYLNEAGSPVSPLYTWQDRRSAPLCRKLADLTGYAVAPGYGLATHCALAQAASVPADAAKLCTIMDYIGISLVQENRLRMHTSNGASLGFFNIREGRFDEEALKKLGICPDLLPAVTGEPEIIGYYRGISVSVAIGDNQASFLGSVADPETMALANFGTGSQISLKAKDIPSRIPAGLEIRPLGQHDFLVCGSALCGGRAYALLEQFFRSFAAACGFSVGSVYPALNRMALEGLEKKDLPSVITTFCGTRSEPEKTGGIANLKEENFTPEAVTAGVLLGMARELFGMFDAMPGGNICTLIASGNAIRRNPALVQALEAVFSMQVFLPAHQEEAAFGAAIFGAAAAGEVPPETLAKRCVHYG